MERKREDTHTAGQYCQCVVCVCGEGEQRGRRGKGGGRGSSVSQRTYMSKALRDRIGFSFIWEVVSIVKVISRNSQPSLSRGKLYFLREITTQPTCGSHGIGHGWGGVRRIEDDELWLQDRGLSADGSFLWNEGKMAWDNTNSRDWIL